MATRFQLNDGAAGGEAKWGGILEQQVVKRQLEGAREPQRRARVPRGKVNNVLESLGANMELCNRGVDSLKASQRFICCDGRMR
jgi:hypothetical protein